MMEAVQTALKDPSIRNASVYAAAAFGGMGLNYLARWGRGEEANVLHYLFKFHPGRTVAAFVTNLIAIAAFVSTGALNDASLAVALALGITQGYVIDNSVNKGKRKVWTPTKRKRERKEENG